MGEETKISWSDATFNAWFGCARVEGSPACGPTAEYPDGPICYAEAFVKRIGYSESGKHFPIWGAHEQRRFFTDKHWNAPLKWDAAARAAGVMKYVFCMSMGDWAEGRPDQAPHRARLWELQAKTTNIIWLMLTKRSQLIRKLSPQDPADPSRPRRWFGVTAENQRWFDLRWSHLREVDSPIYWISAEPMFGPITLPNSFLDLGPRAWIIAGGATGGHAQPTHPEWFAYLRDQCLEAGVVFHFKQHGEWVPGTMIEGQKRYPTKVFSNGKWESCSDDWITEKDQGTIMYRVGAKNAEALLEGVAHLDRAVLIA